MNAVKQIFHVLDQAWDKFDAVLDRFFGKEYQ